MKKIFTCLCIASLCFVKTQALHAQVNVQDSLALVDLYNSTNGADWYNHTNWLTTKLAKNWYGVTVTNGRVTKVDLYHNHLVGQIPSSLGSLSKLDTLILNNNQLTGSIPSSFGNLFNLQYLYLYNNQLSGTIPSSLGKLTNLRYLSLAYNSISGSIPRSLGKLYNLEYLFLYHNKLSGSIPSSLGMLSNLLYLNLAYNQLSGTIPSSLDSLNLAIRISVSYNMFTFAGMEGLVQANYPNTLYAPQSNIHIAQKNDSVLSVDAGGTLSNNTYKWYKDGILIKKKTGDKNFTITGAGKYNVVITNAIAKALTLYSHTITITGFSADKNVISKPTTTKAFVYPNPANNFIHLTLDKPASSNTNVVLYNMQGKTMMQQPIVAGSLKQQYSISNLAAGDYLLVILDNGKNIHEERLVIVR